MKVHVPSIPDEGLNFHFDTKTPWFDAMLKERLRENYAPKSNAQADIQLSRTNENVSVSGKAQVNLKPTCSRCLKNFLYDFDVPFLWHMTPYFENPTASGDKEEEVELTADDLDFSFYHNDEIDLADVLGEEILLALPIRFLCEENCRGLCPHCGANLNEVTCQCHEANPASPFAVLKNLKLKS